MRLLSYFLALGLIALFSTGLSASTFVGGFEGNIWTDARNWDPQAVPGSGDVAEVPSGKQVNVNGDLTVGTLILGGILGKDTDPNSKLTITTDFSMTNGTVGCPVYLLQGCASLWQGSSGINANVFNHGEITVSGNTSVNYAVITNHEDGVIKLSGGFKFQIINNPAVLDNYGTLNRTGVGGGLFEILLGGHTNYAGSQTIVEDGELYASSLDNHAPITIFSGATFRTYDMRVFDGSSITGGGTFVSNGNGLYMNNNDLVTVDVAETVMNSQGVKQNGPVNFTQHIDWQSGTMLAQVTFTTSCVVDINPGSGKGFTNTTINNGTINVNDSFGFDAGRLDNNGTINLNGAYSTGIYHASEGTHNYGTIKKPAGANGTFNMGSPLYNETGAHLLVQQDELYINASFYNAGEIVVSSGATLRTNAMEARNGGTLTGAGTFIIQNNGVNAVNTAPISFETSEIVLNSNINGTGAVTLANHVNWTAGTLGAPVTFATGAVVDMNTNAGHGISGTTTNNGTFNINTNFTLSAGNIHNNGILNLNGAYTIGIYYGTDGIFNHGTVKKTAGDAGIYNMGVPLTNYSDGQVTVEEGTLNVGSDFHNYGSLSISAGAAFKSNSVHVYDGASFSGAGTYYVTYNGLYGHTTSNVNFEVAETVWESNLNGDGPISFTQHVSWTNGSIGGNLVVTIASGATLDLTTNGYHSLGWTGILTNNGIMNANVSFGGGTINNYGTLNLAPGINFGGGTLNNAGTMSNNIGGSVSSNYMINNTGSILVTDGTFTFSNSVSNAGTLDIAADANAIWEGYNNALETGSNITGAGTFTLNSNMLVNDDLSLGVDTFTMNTGTLEGNGALTITHTFHANGLIQNAVIIANGGTINVNGVTLYGTLTNNGTVQCNGDFLFNGDQVLVQNNAEFHLGSGVTLGSNYAYLPLGYFENAGTVDKSSTESAFLNTHFANHTGALLDLQNGTTEILTFENEGNVNVGTDGALVIKGGHNLTGGALNGSGVLSIQGDGWHLTHTLTINTLHLEIDGNLSADPSATLEVQNHATWISGEISVPVNIASGGTFDVADVYFSKTLSAVLTNAGTFNLPNSFTANANINNSGNFNFTTGGGNFFGPDNFSFTNTGIVLQNASSSSTIGIPAINNGTITIESTPLIFDKGLENNASVTIGAGATLVLYSNTAFNIGSTVTGAGSIEASGELTLGADFSFAGELFTLYADLIGPGVLNIESALVWSNGNLQTEVNIANGATLEIGNSGGGNNSKMSPLPAKGSNLKVFKSAFHTQKTLSPTAVASPFSNHAPGVLMMNSNGPVLSAELNNHGTATQHNYYDMNGGVFNNFGQLNSEYGGIYDAGNGGNLNNTGTWTLDDYFDVFVNTTNNGTLNGNSPNLNFDPQWQNNGTVAPGTSPGQIRFAHSYENGAELHIEVQNSDGPGIGHDYVESQENISLSGALVVTETGSPLDGEYVIMRCNGGPGCLSGTFASTSLPGDYTVTYTGEEVILTKGQPATVSPSDTTICGGSPVTLTASAGESYQWSTGENSQSIEVSPYDNSTYYVTVYDANGGGSIGNASINVNPAPYAYVTPSYSYLCEGESVTLTVYGDNGSYLWDNGETTQSITVSPTTTVTYYVTLTADNGCNVVSSATVEGTTNQPIIPEINGVPDSVCQNDPAFYLETYQSGVYGEWSGPGVYYGYYYDPYGLSGPQALTFTPYPGQCALPVNWTIEITNATWYADTDGDGYGDPLVSENTCEQPSGYVSDNTDCDDTNASIHPNATETCNDLDDDCDGQVDEGVQNTYYADADGDGYGNEAAPQQACSQPQGYVLDHTDCNDNNAAVHPDASETCNGLDDDCNGLVDDGVQSTFYVDADGDGFGNANSSIQACDAPPGYVNNSNDCNDNNDQIHPGAQEVCNNLDDDCDGETDEGVQSSFYADTDGDGYGDANNSVQACSAPTGYVSDNTDCDDNNASRNPGAQEICNNQDDDCDGLTDENLNVTWYADADGDGYGNASIYQTGCTQPSGYVADNTDCDDTRANVHPNAPEVCNGRDDDCDGQTDEGVQSTFYQDADGDGYGNPDVTMQSCGPDEGYVANSNDCDDTNPAIHPDASEICDGLDNDCDNLVDNDDPNVTGQDTWYADEDGDGYGNAEITQLSCTQPAGFVSNDTDCDDNNALVNPGANELCNLIDDDCDGLTDEGVQSTFYADTDGDGFGNASVSIQACTAPAGYVADATDCNDSNDQIYPGATEVCNGIDDDCDGTVDEGLGTIWYADADGDGYGNDANALTACTQPAGYVTDNTDCNDQNASVHPNAVETCNNLDDDCDGLVDEGGICDGDGDGYTVEQGDCDDENPDIHPNATEICNNLDDDCDGLIDETNLNLTLSSGNILCNGGTTTLTALATGGSAPFQYSLDGGPFGNSGNLIAGAGSHYVTVRDANGCEVTNIIDINEPSAISIDPILVTHVACGGGNTGAVNISVAGGTPGYSYHWSNNRTTQDLVNIGANTYTVAVTDANGCVATASATVNPKLKLTLSKTNTTCNGGNDGTATATATGGTPDYSYAWNTGANTPTISGLTVGTYTCTITDALACTRSAQISVGQPSAIGISGVVTKVTCYGSPSGVIAITLSNGVAPFTYAWSDGASTEDRTALTAGTYTLTVTDVNGCSREKSFNVTQPSALALNFNVSDVSCNGYQDGEITANASGGTKFPTSSLCNGERYCFDWSHGDNARTTSGIGAGEYTVTVTDANGCSIAGTATVTEPELLEIVNVQVDPLPNGKFKLTVSATGGTPNYKYKRIPGGGFQGNNIFNNVPAGAYDIVVRDRNICETSTSVTVGSSGKPGDGDERGESGNVIVFNPGTPVLAYPNPASERFQLKAEKPFNQAKVSIYNAQGRLLEERKFEDSTDLGAYEVARWESGLYLVIANLDGTRYVQKVMVANQ